PFPVEPEAAVDPDYVALLQHAVRPRKGAHGRTPTERDLVDRRRSAARYDRAPILADQIFLGDTRCRNGDRFLDRPLREPQGRGESADLLVGLYRADPADGRPGGDEFELRELVAEPGQMGRGDSLLVVAAASWAEACR